MVFELRQYRAWPGQRAALAKYMDEIVIPFQSSKGMVIIGSWVGETEEDLYVWIRRFESEAEREQQYNAVYQSEEWKGTMGPRIGELMDRSKIVVYRLESTPRSILR